MNATFSLKIKIKPEYTSRNEILVATLDATLTINKNKIRFKIQLEESKSIFVDYYEEHKAFGKIFFEVQSVIPNPNFSNVVKVDFKDENIISQSITNLGNKIEIFFQSIEFEIEEKDSTENDIFCMYYDNIPSYRDFYNIHTCKENTFEPTFEIERKYKDFHQLIPEVTILPELQVDVKDEVQETVFKKNSFITFTSTLDADNTIQCVYTLDLIFSFYYRKKIKCNFIKYLVNKRGKIVYNVFDNTEIERFPTFHLGMQNKFILLFNINFEIVHTNSVAFKDIVNSYIIAAQSEDKKSRFILYYSVLELLKANFSDSKQTNFQFKKFDRGNYVKTFLEQITKYLTVENDNLDGSKLKAEAEILTSKSKIEYLSQAIAYKPLKKQFDPLLQKYPMNLEKYGISLHEIIKLRGAIFHGGSLSNIAQEYLKKISNREYLPKFTTELIVKVMGGDPEKYNYNIYEEYPFAKINAS
jgi:hypothetical protein